jgi:hypothetical protein
MKFALLAGLALLLRFAVVLATADSFAAFLALLAGLGAGGSWVMAIVDVGERNGER